MGNLSSTYRKQIQQYAKKQICHIWNHLKLIRYIYSILLPVRAFIGEISTKLLSYFICKWIVIWLSCPVSWYLLVWRGFKQSYSKDQTATEEELCQVERIEISIQIFQMIVSLKDFEVVAWSYIKSVLVSFCSTFLLHCCQFRNGTQDLSQLLHHIIRFGFTQKQFLGTWHYCFVQFFILVDFGIWHTRPRAWLGLIV